MYYETLFVISMLLAALYVFTWRKHLDTTFAVVFTIIPISCLGYVFFINSKSLEEALIANKIIYIGGCFLQYFIMANILNLCDIKINKWLKRCLFLYCVLMYVSVLSIGHSPYFYKEVAFETSNGIAHLEKTYGFMHTLFYVFALLFCIINLIAIIYSYLKKKQVSRRILYLLFLPDIVTILSYFLGKYLLKYYEFTPISYIFAEVMYLLIAYRVSLYDISDTVIDSMVQNGDTGFISFDSSKRYLGCNATAIKIIPELANLYVDSPIPCENAMEKKLIHWLDSFAKDNDNHEFIHIKNDDKSEDDKIYYVISVSYLYDGKRKRGYIITLTDDTQSRKYIRLLDNYNENLQKEVEEKTKHIIEMHDNLIMSLATMVESRDNSTGGHIKRTSIGVQLLTEELMKENLYSLSEEFCKDIIKAAPMHDLGKIAVDDAVLRKPGRFTPEEFEKMKSHTTEGARVIHEILEKTDDEAFKIIAENVAHYHHERWDGSGYPKGLKGEEIPIESRIMAIADVYDALVSKRVYKDSMSFEQADSIIMDGMGTQFDPQLEKIYVKVRPKLEEYYAQITKEMQ